MTRATLTYVTSDATCPIGDGPRIIAHCCNDVGAWGAGFVLALSRRWPIAEEAYRAWFIWPGHGSVFGSDVTGPPMLGEVQFVVVESHLWVANLIGQRGVSRTSRKSPIRYDAIREGLGKVADFAHRHGATVHMPRMGAGLAGGDWAEIEKIVQKKLCDHMIAVTVYDLPQGGVKR